MTNFCLECSPFGLASSLSSVHYCSSESQTSTLRLTARVTLAGGGHLNTQKSRHTCTCMYTHFLSASSQHHTLTQALFLSFFLPLSLTHTHTTLLPQESDLFIVLLCVGVGGGMAVLFHPAQTGSQINILSPTGQLVQAGQTASENLSLWFSRLPSLIKEKKPGCYVPSSNTCVLKEPNFAYT